jgi:hypothetical protein
MPTDRGQQVVVLCANEADGDLAPAEFYGPGGRRATGARLSLQSLALRRARAQPHAFYDGGYTWVIDHAHGALHRFPGDHTVRWAADGRALLLQGDDTTLLDSELGLRAPLAFDAGSVFLMGSGPVLWSGSTLVDVAQRRVLGRVAEEGPGRPPRARQEDRPRPLSRRPLARHAPLPSI